MPGLDETRPFIALSIVVLTISDTRTEADDISGQTLTERIEKAGHTLRFKRIVRDDQDSIEHVLKECIADKSVDVVVSTGERGLRAGM